MKDWCINAVLYQRCLGISFEFDAGPIFVWLPFKKTIEYEHITFAPSRQFALTPTNRSNTGNHQVILDF